MPRFANIALLIVIMGMLGACRAEEQGRPLFYEKGVYGGKADTSLTGEQVEKLARHARRQGG